MALSKPKPPPYFDCEYDDENFDPDMVLPKRMKYQRHPIQEEWGLVSSGEYDEAITASVVRHHCRCCHGLKWTTIYTTALFRRCIIAIPHAIPHALSHAPPFGKKMYNKYIIVPFKKFKTEDKKKYSVYYRYFKKESFDFNLFNTKKLNTGDSEMMNHILTPVKKTKGDKSGSYEYNYYEPEQLAICAKCNKIGFIFSNGDAYDTQYVMPFEEMQRQIDDIENPYQTDDEDETAAAAAALVATEDNEEEDEMAAAAKKDE